MQPLAQRGWPQRKTGMILVNKPAGAGLSAEPGNIGSSPDSAAAGLVILAFISLHHGF